MPTSIRACDRATIAATAVVAAVALLISACGGTDTTSDAPPTINFGSLTGSTPGMSGNGTLGAGMPNMPGMSAPTASTAAPAAANAVNIDSFAFAPATLAVPVGTTVTWTNKDEEPHTVVAEDNSFHSPGMGSNATFSFTFSNVGTFDYVCSIHPFIHGTVVVTK